MWARAQSLPPHCEGSGAETRKDYHRPTRFQILLIGKIFVMTSSFLKWNAAVDQRLGKVIHQALPCTLALPTGNITQKVLGINLGGNIPTNSVYDQHTVCIDLTHGNFWLRLNNWLYEVFWYEAVCVCCSDNLQWLVGTCSHSLLLICQSVPYISHWPFSLFTSPALQDFWGNTSKVS